MYSFLCAKNCSKGFGLITYLLHNVFSLHNEAVRWVLVSSPNLQVRSVKHRMVKSLVHGHTESERQKWDLNLGCLSRVCVLNHA